MDPEIQKGLEDYLHGRNAKARVKSPAHAQNLGQGFEERLAQADEATRSEMAEFTRTASLLHALQAPDDESLQPAPGFYARVMERIEAQRAGNSFWSVFLNPQFSARLLMASGVLLVLLGVTLATTENDQGLFGTAAPELVEVQQGDMMPDFAMETASEPIEVGLVSHSETGHDQMLVQLATYQE
jgi:hypothetical protein